jgi:hypothetical protein
MQRFLHMGGRLEDWKVGRLEDWGQGAGCALRWAGRLEGGAACGGHKTCLLNVLGRALAFLWPIYSYTRVPILHQCMG